MVSHYVGISRAVGSHAWCFYIMSFVAGLALRRQLCPFKLIFLLMSCLFIDTLEK